MTVQQRPASTTLSASMAPLLERVRAVAVSTLRPEVEAIDHGLYPVDILRAFGEAGAYRQHLSGRSDSGVMDLGAAIQAMAVAGEECLSTAFCMWCQDACGWYLEHTSNDGLRARLLDGVSTGALPGGTGLSNPMKSLSGIEGLRLRGKRAAGGWIVSGTLPWVSNLGDGHYFGISFGAKEDASSDRMVMALARIGDPGVLARQNVKFIALEGTATMTVTFADAFISDDFILADPAPPFIRAIKPGFILLQTGMAIGLVRGCIGLMEQCNTNLGAINAHLPEGVACFSDKLAAAEAEIMTLAATPMETDPDFMARVLQARLLGAELSLAASQASMLHAGARAYVEGSAASRRLRESYFVAIVTPAMKHLRKDHAALRTA